MKSKKLDLLFYLIPLLLIIYLILRWRFTKTASPDTYSYIDLAKVLPYISQAEYKSLFPIGYPTFLKVLGFLSNSYEIAYKIGALICMLYSLIFVKIKNFYWREIWSLLTFYTFLSILPWGWSETLMIPLLIMVFYYNHQFLNNQIPRKKFILFYPILLFTCVLVKYSSLFFIIAHFVFAIFLKFSKDKKFWDYLQVFIISSILSSIYLLYNYIITGKAMGKRIPPTEEHLQVAYSLHNIPSGFIPRPFLYPKTEQWQVSLDWILPPILGGFFSILLIRMIYNYFIDNCLKNRNLLQLQITLDGKMMIFNILMSILFLLGTIYSYFTTTIDPLRARLLLGFYLFFFFSVIIALPKFKNRNIFLLIMAICLLSINIIKIIITK